MKRFFPTHPSKRKTQTHAPKFSLDDFLCKTHQRQDHLCFFPVIFFPVSFVSHFPLGISRSVCLSSGLSTNDNAHTQKWPKLNARQSGGYLRSGSVWRKMCNVCSTSRFECPKKTINVKTSLTIGKTEWRKLQRKFQQFYVLFHMHPHGNDKQV